MRTADEWFERYAESHKNPINKAIHWVCIPLITLSTLGLLQAIPTPVDLPLAHAGTLASLLALGFYLRLSWTLAAGMTVFGGACLLFNAWMATVGQPVGWVSAGIFGAAWVAQFVGHKIEGKKPSFFDDLQFLLVGPAWLLQFVYRRVGIPVVPGAAPA
jgi:uncharacterized membrane protein YGL010W